ncbi:MAG: ATP-binding cassette domain-containing protein [Tepidiformaceae bacterium]
MQAIVANQLFKHFAPDIKAVDGIDLDIPEGQIFGFLGQNGSGKTTTVKMLTTLLKPTSGHATVGGIDVFRDPERVRKSVGVAMQEVGLDELQTGRELMTLQARLFGISGREAKKRVSELLEIVSLTDAADRPTKGYSGGMKRRLDLVCALVHQPRIVFLDEPTTGLDPITREAVWRYVVDLNQQGVTFFLTTQYLEEADRLTHDIAIMDAGKIVAQGSPAQLKSAIGSDAITLVFEGPDALPEAEPVLRRFEGVEDVRITDREAIVYIRNGSAAIAGIVRLMDEEGLRVARLGLTNPSLDDVFLRATGHHLEVSETTQAAAKAAAAGGA